MPLSLAVEVASVREKRGAITALSVSTAASTASPTTTEGAEDDFNLLARLQGIPIHAPPGPRPSRIGARAPTKTQIMSDRKAERDAKAKAADEKKALTAARKAESKARQQEKLILTAETKAAKAVAKTDDLRLKLEEAVKASTKALANIPSAETAHSHKKSKVSSGGSTVSPVALSYAYRSPQRKGSTDIRVSVQSPRQFPPASLSSSGSSASSLALSEGVLTIGDDSDDKESDAEEADISDTASAQRNGIRAEPRGGRRYGKPARRGRTTSTLGSARSPHHEDSGSASSMEEDSDKGSDDGSSGTSESEGGVMVDSTERRLRQIAALADGVLKSPPELQRGRIPADATSVSSDAEEDDLLDGIWPGSHDVRLVTCFVFLHFNGDWTAYLQFAKWADDRTLTHSGVAIWLEDWLRTVSGEALEDGTALGDQRGLSEELADERQGGAEVERSRYSLGSLGGIVNNTMCNKTCSSLPPHLGDGMSTLRSEKAPPSRSSAGTRDIRTLFPAASRTRTPQELAMKRAVEENIASLEAKEQALAVRVEVLREQFAADAREKTAAEREVRWSPEASVVSASRPNEPMHPSTPGVTGRNRGSKSWRATKIDRLNAQIKEQERLADTAKALAASLRVPSGAPKAPTTLECPQRMVKIPEAGSGPSTQQSLLSSNLALIRWDVLVRTPPTGSISGLSSTTPERTSALTPSRFAPVLHTSEVALCPLLP
jgi:hypothetical protein